jgi:tRNA threonylcarbamoyladenosine biosynthesis protein TsaB
MTGRLVLALDTASVEASVALGDDDGLRAERRWTVDTTISKELLAEISALLAEAGVGRDAVESMAVSVGPGGYGGLRAGVATAQGMALALGVPLAAVSRLEADAAPHLRAEPAGRAVVAVHDARRSGYAWAAYACPAGERLPSELVAPTMSSPEQCVADAPAGALWCGEVTDALGAAIEAADRSGDELADAAWYSRAAAVLELARKRDNYDDPAQADVVYLRPPSITKPNPTTTIRR